MLSYGTVMSTGNANTLARSCCAGLAGLALVILSGSLAETAYGPKTTIGANYQQTSDTTSVNQINQAACVAAFNCYFLFQTAPQQKPLIVQHVSCRVFASVGELRYGELRTREGQALPFIRTPLAPVSTGGGWWVVNTPVMHLLKSGERAYVGFNSGAAADWNGVCTISGRLQQP